MSDHIYFSIQHPRAFYLEGQCSYGEIPEQHRFPLKSKPVTHLVAIDGHLYAAHESALTVLARYDKDKAPQAGQIISSRDGTILVLNDQDLQWVNLAPCLEDDTLGPKTYNLLWG